MCGGAAAVSCDPDCTGHSLGDLVENPKNCSEYYYCFGDGLVAPDPVPCDDGFHFDVPSASCIADGPDPCNATCSGGDGGVNCQLTCVDGLDYVSSFDDCGSYFECKPSGPVGPIQCPSNHPYFDGETCGNDEQTCCVSSCDAHCDAEGSVVPDPKDCKKFYICRKEGEVEEILHYPCPNNWNFDIQLGECTSTASCTILCTDSGSSNSSDSTPTISITTTPSSSGCITSFTCPNEGGFPACTTCQPDYFTCAAANEQGVLAKCPGEKVFNPVSPYICISPGNCPFEPV